MVINRFHFYMSTETRQVIGKLQKEYFQTKIPLQIQGGSVARVVGTKRRPDAIKASKKRKNFYLYKKRGFKKRYYKKRSYRYRRFRRYY